MPTHTLDGPSAASRPSSSSDDNPNATRRDNVTTSAIKDLRGSTSVIENNHITIGARMGYIHVLTTFMIFLYNSDAHRHLLTDLVPLQEANQKDTAELESTAGRSCTSHRRVAGKLRDRHFRAKCQRQLLRMCRKDADSSPTRLTGVEVLNYECVAAFMNMNGNTETVNRGLATHVQNEDAQLSNRERRRDGSISNDSNETVQVKVQQSKSAYTAVQRAIAYLYRQNNVKRSEEFKQQISTYIAGCTRRSKSHKQQLGLKVVEGKREMSKAAFSVLAKYFFGSGKMEHVFAHLFLVLDWNLMKQAENCVNARINHIYFQDDALVFQFAKSKGHQMGEDHVGPWHVYSNLDEPHLCPVLSLSHYLFCFPEIMKPNSPLFEGTSQYGRYSKLFHAGIKTNWMALASLGYKKGDLGTHSCRKGAATMVLSGCTVAPPIVSVCIRTGWVMGGVKDRYLKYKSAGNQYVGQCATGKNPLSKRFDFSILENESEQLGLDRKIKGWLDERMDRYQIAPETRAVARVCFASVCYHFDYLSKHLSTSCPLRASKFFINIPDEFLNIAVIRFPWTKSEFTPRITGIPPHVVLMAEMEELKMVVNKLKLGIGKDIDNAFERHMQCNLADYRTNCIVKAISESQQKMENLLTSMGRTTGAPFTFTNDNDAKDASTTHDIFDEGDFVEVDGVTDDGNEDSVELANAKKRKNREKGLNALKRRVLTLGCHNERLQVVPVHWKFPKMTFQQLCFNWNVMNTKENVPPYSLLMRYHVSHLKQGSSNLRMMKAIMTVVERIGRERGCWYDGKSWNVVQVHSMIEGVAPDLQRLLNLKSSNRMKELSWKTIYNKMSNTNLFGGKGNGRGRRRVG